eukprot:scpid35608/ scgid2241/ Neural cell adhesion molecule L1.1
MHYYPLLLFFVSSSGCSCKFVIVHPSMSGVGLAVDTKEDGELLSAVASLKPLHRDNDRCETFSLRALWNAVASSPVANNSVILVITDSQPMDQVAGQIVLEKALQKRVMINFIIAGHCTMLAGWRLHPIYYRLAEATGGQMMVTQRQGQAAHIMTSLLYSLARMPVHLFRQELIASDQSSEQSLLIPFDMATANISIVIMCSEPLIAPRISVIDSQTGRPVAARTIRTANGAILSLTGSFDSDLLSVSVDLGQANDVCSLSVLGTSHLHVDYRFRFGDDKPELLVLESKAVEIASGNKITIVSRTDSSFQIDHFDIVSVDGRQLDTQATMVDDGLSAGAGAREQISFPLSLPPLQSAPFRLRFRGKTSDGIEVQRVTSQLFLAEPTMTINASMNTPGTPTVDRLLPTSKVLRLAGDTVALTCPVVGANGVTWSRQGSSEGPITATTGRVRIAGDRLIITDSVIMDTAIFICQSAGQVQRILMTIYDPPRILPPTQLIRRFGNCLELECVAAGDPRPKVQWYLNETSLQIDNIITKMTHTGSLQLCGMSEIYVGTYTCRTTIPALGSRSIVLSAQIIREIVDDILREFEDKEDNNEGGTFPTGLPLSPSPGGGGGGGHGMDIPLFSVLSGSVSVVERCVQIRCESLDRDEDCVTIWLKKGVPVSTLPRATVFSNGTMQVCNPTSVHTGDYTCLLANSQHIATKTVTVNMQVLLSSGMFGVQSQAKAEIAERMMTTTTSSPFPDAGEKMELLKKLLDGDTGKSPPEGSHELPSRETFAAKVNIVEEKGPPSSLTASKGEQISALYLKNRLDLTLLDKDGPNGKGTDDKLIPVQPQNAEDKNVHLKIVSETSKPPMPHYPMPLPSQASGSNIGFESSAVDTILEGLHSDKNKQPVAAIKAENTKTSEHMPEASEIGFRRPSAISPARISSAFISISVHDNCLELACPYTGQPSAQLLWFLNDRRVHSSRRGVSVKGDTLTICERSRLRGSADVICRVQNVLGVDTRQAIVDLSVILKPEPPITTPPPPPPHVW